MWCRRVYDPDLDDYRELPAPIPDTDPMYRELIAKSRAGLRAAGRRDRGESE
jgi:hypothetical protein